MELTNLGWSMVQAQYAIPYIPLGRRETTFSDIEHPIIDQTYQGWKRFVA
jgi:hypothetical protein